MITQYDATNDTRIPLESDVIDVSAKANKTDISSIILTGTTNTSGSTISAGTWFYLNGKPCVAKVDIASNATFTKDTNYEEKTVGSALSELNSKSFSKGVNLAPTSAIGTSGWRALGTESDCFIAPSRGLLHFRMAYSNYDPPKLALCYCFSDYATVVNTIKDNATHVYFKPVDNTGGAEVIVTVGVENGWKYVPFVYGYQGSDANFCTWMFEAFPQN